MIITKHFVWIHIPKTGGTWFRETMAKVMPAEWEPEVIYPEHHSWRRIPEEKRQLTRLLMVRNPWDWYVSTFCFWRQHYIGRTGGYVLPACEWSPTELAWAERLERTRPRGIEPGELWVQRGIRDYMQEESQAELLDRLADYWHGATRCYVVGFEKLRENTAHQLDHILYDAGLEMSPAVKEALATAPPEMVSLHEDYRVYYDEQLWQEVAEREALVISTFGYEAYEDKCEY